MPLTERFGRGGFNLSVALAAMTTALTPPIGHGFPSTGHTLAQCDDEIIGIADLSAATWTLERAVEGIAVGHPVQARFEQVVTPMNLGRLMAVAQAGTVLAVGQKINFPSGAVVSQVGDAIQVDLSVGGGGGGLNSILTDSNGDFLVDDSGNVLIDDS